MKIYGNFEAVKPGKIMVKWNGKEPEGWCANIKYVRRTVPVIGETFDRYLIVLPGRGWKNTDLGVRIQDLYGIDVGSVFYQVAKKNVYITNGCIMP